MFRAAGQRTALQSFCQHHPSFGSARQSSSFLWASVAASHTAAVQDRVASSTSSALAQRHLYTTLGQPCSNLQYHTVPPSQVKQTGAFSAALSVRWFSGSKLKPKHVGGKLKVYSSFKERFKLTANGKIKYMPPGHRHKRSAKTADQNRALRKSNVLFSTYANTMKRLGFRMTSY